MTSESSLFVYVLKDYTKYINAELKSKLYPNPNNGEFNIELANLPEDNKTVEIYVYDIAGKLLLTKTEQLEQTTLNINPNLTNGTYLVKVKLPGGTCDIHSLIIE